MHGPCMGLEWVLCIYIIASGLVFMGFLNMWTSGSLILVCSLVLLIFLFCPIVMCWLFLNLITLYFNIIPLKPASLLLRDRKGGNTDGRRSGKKQGSIEIEETITRIYYMRKKNLFSILKKESDALYIDAKCSIQTSKWRQDEIQM